MGSSTETTATWFLGHNHKPTSHHLLLSSKRILRLFQVPLEVPGLWWLNSPSTPYSADRARAWEQSDECPNHLSKCYQPIKMKIDMLETSWTVTFLFSWTSFFTWSIFSTVLLIDGHPKCSATSTEITLELGKPGKKLCPIHFLLSEIYFQHIKCFHSISPQLRAKFNTNMLFFQIRHFLGT